MTGFCSLLEKFYPQEGQVGKMKRTRFVAILTVVLLIGLGCAAEIFGAVEETGAKTDPLAVVREYGEPNAILDSEGKFSIVLRYPRTGIDAADKAIYEWASGLYNSTKEDAISRGKQDGLDEPAETELDVVYNAFKVHENYAGIEEVGYLSGPFLAHPVDIVKTFNVDIEGKKLLTIDEILNNNAGKALDLLKKKIAERHPDLKDSLSDFDIDETWLTYSVIKPSGVDVLLSRGEYLPSYLGLQRFTLTYDEIGGFLKGR
jgi:hypothetical protein